MKIYTLQIDPDTEYVDPKTAIREIEADDMGDYYQTKIGRRISKDSLFTAIFDSSEEALNYKKSSLVNQKKMLREQLRTIEAALIACGIKGTKKNQLIRVTDPKGNVIRCTRTEAQDIAGLSRSGVHHRLSVGTPTKTGFLLERIV